MPKQNSFDLCKTFTYTKGCLSPSTPMYDILMPASPQSMAEIDKITCVQS